MHPHALVSIVVLTHNSLDFVETCLDSIRRATIYPSYEVLVVDNASTDETREKLQTYADSDQRIHLIPITDNQNFAAANNIGVLHSQGSYLVFLNVDTVVTPGWLGKLVGHVQKDESIGTIVPVTNWAGNEARIEVPYHDLFEMEHFAGVLAKRKKDETIEIKVAPLFCALIPRKVWDEAGQLDTRYEVGMLEDDDYSVRVKQLGLRIVCAEDCFVHHFGRVSFEKIEAGRYQQIFERNRARFEAKWGRPWAPHNYREGVTAEPRRFRPEEFLCHPHSRKISEKNRQIAELSQKLEESRERSARELEAGRRRTAQQLEASRQRLSRSEDLLRQAATGIRGFEDEFRGVLATYESQRAWTAMLIVRKAYGLLAGKGLQGVFAFGRWLTKLSMPSGMELKEYDLKFPSVQEHVPVELQLEMEHAQQSSPPTPRTGCKYDLVALPVFEFDFRFQRPQQLARQFARGGHRVFWVSTTRGVPNEEGCPYRLVELEKNLWEVQLRENIPDIFRDRLTSESAREIVKCLRQLYFDFAISESCVLPQLPFWRSVALGLRDLFDAKVVYDCMDDWESMPNISEFNRTEQRELIRESNVQLASAQRLVEGHAAQGRKSVLVRNGVDFRLFSGADPNEELHHVPRPIVGYFGSIAEWFDYELLYTVAASRPHYSFVLIGGYGLEEQVVSAATSRLRELPNVHFLGHKNHGELPAYLANFDACIIPFIVNPLTCATDPVKLYEYFSQGKPVVSTPLDEVGYWSDLVYFGDGPEEFAASLDLAVNEDSEHLRQRRLTVASENTWSRRFSEIDKAIGESFPHISIVIEGGEDVEDVKGCIEAIRRFTSYPSFDVLVLQHDDGVGIEKLSPRRSGMDGRITAIDGCGSRDWAGISRIALERSGAEFWVLLNAKMRVTRGWLGRLLRHCSQDDRSIGAVVPVSNWPASKTRVPLDDTGDGVIEAVAAELGRRKMLQHSLIESAQPETPPLGCVFVPRDVMVRVAELESDRESEGVNSGCEVVFRSVKELGLSTSCAEDCFVHDERIADQRTGVAVNRGEFDRVALTGVGSSGIVVARGRGSGLRSGSRWR